MITTQTVSQVASYARGQWDLIFSRLGIDVPQSGKHGPCPVCGGNDRFHFDNKDNRGTWHCRQCDGRRAGDGLDLVAKVRRIPLIESANIIAEALRINVASLPPPQRHCDRPQEAEQLEQTQEAARERAVSIWSTCINSESHPYFVRKHTVIPGARQLTQLVCNGKSTFPPGTLVIPVNDIMGNLQSLEFIKNTGPKQVLCGSRRKGGSFLIGSELIKGATELLVCEGAATGATLFFKLGRPVLCAFSANNLTNVCRQANATYGLPIIIAADDEPGGRKYAMQAAEDVNGYVLTPPFTQQQSSQLSIATGKRSFTDWNDYANQGGNVAEVFEEALDKIADQGKVSVPFERKEYIPTEVTNHTYQQKIPEDTSAIARVEVAAGTSAIPPESGNSPPSISWDNQVARHIADSLVGRYAFDPNSGVIFSYDPNVYHWKALGLAERHLGKIVYQELSRHYDNFSAGKVTAIAKLITYEMATMPPVSADFIAFTNGVLNPKTGKFLACDVRYKYHRSNTNVEYNHFDGSATHCPAFQQYLSYISGLDNPQEPTERAQERHQLILAALIMVLLRRSDWQMFIEIVGSGGTGKTTASQLFSMLVGESATATVEAKDLEIPERRADFQDAALIYLPDMGTYQGEGQGLKKITGGDPVSCRHLYGNQYSAFIKAIVLAVNNTPMRFNDHGGAIARRRILIKLNRTVPPKERKPELISALRDELPAIIAYLLKWSESVGGRKVVKHILLDGVNSADAAEVLTETDPMTGFAAGLHYSEDAQCHVGGKPSNRQRFNPRAKLFHAYLAYCAYYNHDAKHTQRTFSAAFEVAAKRFGKVSKRSLNGRSLFRGVSVVKHGISKDDKDIPKQLPEWLTDGPQPDTYVCS